MGGAREEKKPTSPVIDSKREVKALMEYFSQIFVEEERVYESFFLQALKQTVIARESIDTINQLQKDKYDYFLESRSDGFFMQDKAPEDKLAKIERHIQVLTDIELKLKAEESSSKAIKHLNLGLDGAKTVQKIYTEFFAKQKDFKTNQEEKAYLDCNDQIIEFINKNLLALKLGKKTEYSSFTIPDATGKPHQVAEHIFRIYDAARSREYKTDKERHLKIISLCIEKLGANKRVWEQIYEKIVKANGDPAKLKGELDELKRQMDAAASVKKAGGLFSRKPKKDKPKVIAQDSGEAEKKGFGSSAYNFIKEKIKRTPKPAASDTPTSRPSPTRRDSKS